MEDARQYETARLAMQDARTRTLEQHAVYLSTLGTGDADYAAKRAYMRDHGLEYTNGTLGYAPSTVHREAAWEATQRLVQAGPPLVTSSGRVDGSSLAQQPRAPGKTFSRETILGVLRGRRADAEMDCPGSPRSNELAYLIRIFESLE